MGTIEKAAARLAQRPKSSESDDLKWRGGVAKGAGMAVDGADDSRPFTRAPALATAPMRLCAIDLDSLRERGYLVPDSPRSQLAQEMRRIKRPLLLNIQKAQAQNQDSLANLIMITSAVPGEGKTFTAVNLAMSMAAEMDRRVLLVDADVARGDLRRRLGVAATRGLSDLLQEPHYLAEDAVLASNVDRLSVLLSGSDSEQIDELFASEMMGTILASLASMDPNRVVIFDAPPLLVTTEAAVLARQVGQVVLVIEANKTPQNTVAQAIGELEGCASVSLVLNKTTGKSASGYGYGYSYGADAESNGAPRSKEAG